MKSNVAATLNNIGNRWGNQNPGLKDRILRALGMIRENKIMHGFAPRVYLVRGSNPGDLYRVTLPAKKGERASCTCPDRLAGRASHCKHIIAVALLLKVDELPTTPLVGGYGLDEAPADAC